MQQFVQSFHLLSGKMPNVSAVRVHDLPDKEIQETPNVLVKDKTIYLLNGKVKFKAQLLRIPDQGKHKLSALF